MKKLCRYAFNLGWYLVNRLLLLLLRVLYLLVSLVGWYSCGTCTVWFTILYNMVRLAFFRRDSNDSHFRSRVMAVIESGWSYLYGALVTNLAALLCTYYTFLVR